MQAFSASQELESDTLSTQRKRQERCSIDNHEDATPRWV